MRENDKPMIGRLQRIIDVVAAYYGTSAEHMKSERHDRRIVIPRHVAMFLAREIIGYSYARISRAFNRSDHTTALHAVRRMEGRIMREPEMRADVNAIRRRLQLDPLPDPAALLMEALL